MQHYRSARACFQTTRDAGSEAKVLGLIAENRRILGEIHEAWHDYQRSLALLSQVRDARRRYGILTEVGWACLHEGMTRSALHFQTAAVETAFGSSRAGLVSAALVRRARIQHRLGNDDRAATDLLESRRWIARISDPTLAERQEAESNWAEGEMLASRQPEVAIACLGQALAYFQASAPLLLPAIYLQRSRAEAARGVDDAAEADLVAGIQARERQRTPLADAAFRVSFFDQAFPLFDDMVRLQITKRRDPERALAFVERGRARELVDSLVGAPATPFEPEALRRELPAGLALVYFVSVPDRLFAWVLTRDGFHFVERALPSAELTRLVAAHRAALEMRAPLGVVRNAAGRLHDELVQPLVPLLAGERVLVFIPDATLQSLAFAGLWNRQTDRYLVEDYVLGPAPSGTVFVQASRVAKPLGSVPRALIVGNPGIDRSLGLGLPSLPGAEAEATEIAGLYGRSELLTGTGATKALFLESLARSRVVHFAGHAASSAEAPSAARLFFAPDARGPDSGALYLRELGSGSFPRTRVVILGACRTAAGTVSRVEGALSLGRPFLAAGVPNVVASLWDIDDAVSRRLFVAFHRALLAGSDPVQALRVAQISFVRDSDPSLAHPANWAAFVCMGGFDPHSLPKGVMS